MSASTAVRRRLGLLFATAAVVVVSLVVIPASEAVKAAPSGDCPGNYRLLTIKQAEKDPLNTRNRDAEWFRTEIDRPNPDGYVCGAATGTGPDGSANWVNNNV